MKTTWDVEPNGKGGWKVQREGAHRAASHHDNKSEAFERARALAKAASDGQVRVKDRGGVIREERTYGHDPRRSKG